MQTRVLLLAVRDILAVRGLSASKQVLFNVLFAGERRLTSTTQLHQYFLSAFLDAPNLICYKNFFALAHGLRLCRGRLFRSSSMAEHPAVNRRVVSSSLTCGAKLSQQKLKRPLIERWPLVFCDVECDTTLLFRAEIRSDDQGEVLNAASKHENSVCWV